MLADDKIMVSICCTTYNHAPFIRQCLDGFLMQKTTFPFEILIHDDASTDDAASIIREYKDIYPDIIKPILQTENQYTKGFLPFFDFNLPRAKGKYIALCEGDDYWIDPLKLQKQVDYLEENEECSLCFTGCRIFKSSGEKKTIRYSLNNLIDVNTYLSKKYFMATASLVFKKNIMSTPTENWMNSAFAGDFILRYRALIKGKIGYLNSISVVYNKGTNGSWSKRKLNKKVILKEYSDNMRGLFYLSKYKKVEDCIFNYKVKELKKNAIYKSAKSTNGIFGFLLACNIKYFDAHLFLSYLKYHFIK